MAKNKTDRTDETILAELAGAVQQHHEGAPGMDEPIKELRKELAAWITEGAKVCPECGNMPHGIRQQAAVKNMPITVYEVGCLVCNGRRAQAVSREGAVDNWNNESYITQPN